MPSRGSASQPLGRQPRNDCSDYSTRSRAPAPLSQSPPGRLCGCSVPEQLCFVLCEAQGAGRSPRLHWVGSGRCAAPSRLSPAGSHGCLAPSQPWNVTCGFILSILEAPWKICLSLLLDRFAEHETTKEHTRVEESQLLIDL